MKNKPIKPFLKWAGGKGQLINVIKQYYPKELGKTINKYAEPFIGGGALLFDVLSQHYHLDVYISDTNAELINTYRILRDKPKMLILMLKDIQSDYLSLDIESRKNFYYEKRKHFNFLKSKGDLGIEVAALFIFLNKTCFNGLYRVNSKGEFNVPMGAYKNPLICDDKNLRNVSDALQNANIICGDYKESNNYIDSNTFAYFDPPYRPLTKTSSFNSYTENIFDDEEQVKLANYIDQLSDRGAYIIASNSDPKNTDPNDNFFDELYTKLHIKRIPAFRMINSKANLRGEINELLLFSF